MKKEEEKVIELIGQELQKAATQIEERQVKLNEAIDNVRGKLFDIGQSLIEKGELKFVTKELESFEYRWQDEKAV